MYCPILDTKLELGAKVPTLASPTLDRIDNDNGYVPGNIWVISNLANIMKSKATVKELIKFSDWVQKSYAVVKNSA